MRACSLAVALLCFGVGGSAEAQQPAAGFDLRLTPDQAMLMVQTLAGVPCAGNVQGMIACQKVAELLAELRRQFAAQEQPK